MSEIKHHIHKDEVDLINKKKYMIRKLSLLLILISVAVIAIVLILGLRNSDERRAREIAEKKAAIEEEKHRKDNFENYEDDKAADDKSKKMKGSQDVVMFGVDSRTGELGAGTRSDSIMIAHIDHDQKVIKIASIYRDTMVSIEGHGYEKITHAHSYGGPELALQTVNTNFDLNAENYVTLNFNSVGNLIDEIGTVEMDITEEEVQYINSYIDEVNGTRGTNSSHITEPGIYQLDGTQAVAYSRIRYTEGGDYKRAERQRTILLKTFEQVKKLSYDEKLDAINLMMGNINTDFSTTEIMELLEAFSKYEMNETTAYPQVFYGGSVEGAWVEVPCTLVDMNTGLHEFLYGEQNYVPSAAVNSISETLSSKVSGPNNDLRENEGESEG